MSENRAIKRFLKNLEQIKVTVAGFSTATASSEVKATLALLHDEWKKFQNLERTLKGKFDEANSEWDKQVEDQHEVGENNYTIGDLMLNQSQFLSEISSLTKKESEVRLPRANIPAYSGDYAEFPSFRDLFEASIHDNTNVSKVHKLQYLKGLLKGEAYSLIKHLATTDANYDEAWEKIKARYDKPKQVIHNLLMQFIEQPNVKPSCPKSIRHLSDVSDEVIRGLKVLDRRAESRDPWLIYLLVKKLDQESGEAWAHATADAEYPTMEQFVTFLNKRSDALETLSSIQSNKANNSKRLSFFSSQLPNIVCPICNENHYLGRCDKYLAMTIPDRKTAVAEKKLCFNCLSSSHHSTTCRSRYSCRICKRRHHITLHPELAPNKNEKPREEDDLKSQSTSTTCIAAFQSNEHPSKMSQAILPTAIVHINDIFQNQQRCRVLLDSGSQTSFISEICVRRLQLSRQRANVSVTGLTSASITSKGKVTLTMQSLYDATIQVQVTALIINSLPSLPTCNIQPYEGSGFQYEQLTDPGYNISAPIDILLGADKVFEILDGAQKQFNTTILHKTLFGWIISGQLSVQRETNSFTSTQLNIKLTMDIDDTLRKFWEIEEPPHTNDTSPEDIACEEYYEASHKRQEDGRYVVRLPFKESSLKLGNSLIVATQRLFAMERKLSKDAELKELYIHQIREYLEIGHITEVPSTQLSLPDESKFYLPHHPVIKLDTITTKVRIVFDGSSKSSTGVSLNEKLKVGPTIQLTLWAILIRFRGHRIATTADIEKMYRQVVVNNEDSEYQRILWREETNQQIRHYKLNRVTFGLACSSYLAIRSLQQLARDEADDTIKQQIHNDFYVDDLLSGSRDIQSSTTLKEELTRVLQLGGFILRKWKLNVSTLCEENNSDTSTDLCCDTASAVKILGLQWHLVDDILTFRVQREHDGPITKRKIISESSRVFDPLGFLSPSILLLKILFQKLWFLKIDWDDPLPEYFEIEYKRIRGQLKYFEEIKIPRFTNHYQNIEFHGFADASEVAYSAVVYSKVADETGNTIINFLTSKTKIAPVKRISLPRLELCAAHLLSKLMSTVKQTIEPTARCYAWTDSSIVLAWLSSYPAKWKTYVANRTSQILDKLPRQHWGHVKSADNPADPGSRGVYPKLLANLSQWWQGPDWLILPESSWPATDLLQINCQAEVESEANKSKARTYAFQSTVTNFNQPPVKAKILDNWRSCQN